MPNPKRVQHVEDIIAKHPGEPLTVENLAPYFEHLPLFDLGDDDLEYYRETHPTEVDAPAEPPIEFEGEPEAKPEAESEAIPSQAKAIAAAKAQEAAEPEAPLPPATPQEIDAAVIRRNAADQTIANARVAVIVAGNVERTARTKLAKAVSAFQSGFAPITREQLVRDMIASEQERKAAGHVSQPQGRPGKSVVDRIAYYGRGGNPARGDYRRGAFPSQARGAPNFDPRRGAVAALPKAPSE